MAKGRTRYLFNDDFIASSPAMTVVAAMSDNTIVIKDTFRFDMVFPLYFPTFSTLANVRAAEFRQ